VAAGMAAWRMVDLFERHDHRCGPWRLRGMGAARRGGVQLNERASVIIASAFICVIVLGRDRRMTLEAAVLRIGLREFRGPRGIGVVLQQHS